MNCRSSWYGFWCYYHLFVVIVTLLMFSLYLFLSIMIDMIIPWLIYNNNIFFFFFINHNFHFHSHQIFSPNLHYLFRLLAKSPNFNFIFDLVIHFQLPHFYFGLFFFNNPPGLCFIFVYVVVFIFYLLKLHF